MKRYWLFHGTSYYPSGGMQDFVDSFDTIEETKSKGMSMLSAQEWAHIYDLKEHKLIYWADEEEGTAWGAAAVFTWREWDE